MFSAARRTNHIKQILKKKNVYNLTIIHDTSNIYIVINVNLCIVACIVYDDSGE